MARPQKHEFKPMNPEKYIGDYPIISRSSWEWEFMKMCDDLSTIITWASEPHAIPYRDPVTGLQKLYIPDFLVTFLINREPVTQLIEIKPIKEAVSGLANNSAGMALVARNNAKWEAAQAWCHRRGIEFRVMDETQLYSGQALTRKGTAIQSWTPAQAKDIRKMALKPRASKAPKTSRKHSMRVPGVRGVSRIPRRPV